MTNNCEILKRQELTLATQINLQFLTYTTLRLPLINSNNLSMEISTPIDKLLSLLPLPTPLLPSLPSTNSSQHQVFFNGDTLIKQELILQLQSMLSTIRQVPALQLRLILFPAISQSNSKAPTAKSLLPAQMCLFTNSMRSIKIL